MMGPYNIQAMRGLTSGRCLLSCRANGVVDLRAVDGPAGRQRWNVQMIDSGAFMIQLVGSTDPNMQCLRHDDLNRVSVGPCPDNFQGVVWQFELQAMTPQIPVYFSIQPWPQSGPEARRVLSCSPDGANVNISLSSDQNMVQLWQMQGPPLNTDGGALTGIPGL